MARRLLTALVLIALAAGAWWIAHDSQGADPGLVVRVEVLDEQGAPVSGAQVERVFENRRQRVDEQGRAELTRVVLRELDTPSPESLARAVRVHAPFHALRPGAAPEVARAADGTWTTRWRLAHHGVLRLYVEETHLGRCKAMPEPAGDASAPALEAIGGSQVARHGAPASYRVFDPAAPIVVRIEGEADADGAIGVATRRVVVDPPTPGHVEEKVLTPEVVAPILGQVVVGDGPQPPSLGGAVTVTQLLEDGGRTPLALVHVPPDGRFLARRTGAGRYELAFELDFFPGTTTLTVLGGASFELTPSSPAIWCRLEHPGVDLGGRRALAQLYASGERREDATRWRGGKGVSHLPLPAAGAYRIRMDVAGTEAEPPLEAECRFQVVRGEAVVACPFQVRPHGTVVVEVPQRALGKARGATVHLLLDDPSFQRTATVIPGLSEWSSFRHVPVGTWDVLVEWDQPDRESSREPVDVRAGETTTLVVEDAGS